MSNLLLVVSSSRMRVTEKTTHTTLEAIMTEDDSPGREKLCKNLIYNAFVWEYPWWNM